MACQKKTKTLRLLTVLLITGGSLFAQTDDSVRYNQYGVRVNRTPLIVEERNGILVFESKDQRHRVWYDIRVQADGAAFFGKPYNEIGNGVTIRRARLAVKTEFMRTWYAELDMDIANSQLEIKDAYLQRTFGENLRVKVGNFKEGFSMESTTTSRYLTFMERPMAVSVFAPSRHLGINGVFNYKALLAIGGIHFRKIDDLEEVTFSQDNNKNMGTDEGVSLTGKIVAMPFWDDVNRGLHFGIAGSYRTPKTHAEIPSSLRYSTRSLSSINRKKYIDTDNITKVDHNYLGGLELAGYYKNFRVQGEYLMSAVKRLEGLENLYFDGWYAMASFIMFGGKYNYNIMEGEFTQVTRGRSWGDVELALRYDYLNLNSGMQTIMGGAGEGYTAGINFYANNNVKIMINYSYLNHDRYASGKRKLFVGYDANGNLTKDPRLVIDAKGKAGEDFHILAIRFEVDF